MAKVEKVVNPPQKPTERKRHHDDEVALYFPNRPNTNPSSKQPKEFTTKVPNGKSVPQALFSSIEIKYLNAPPRKLPAPTRNIDLNIITRYIINNGQPIGLLTHTKIMLFFHITALRHSKRLFCRTPLQQQLHYCCAHHSLFLFRERSNRILTYFYN